MNLHTDNIRVIGPALVFGAIIFGGARACNVAWNTRNIETPAHHTESYATGLNGHIEYTLYYDGSQDVKVYPSLGHRLFDSELYQDLNGDNVVDRIRQNGGEFKMNRLTELLVRDFDYQTHKDRFDEADALLRKVQGKE